MALNTQLFNMSPKINITIILPSVVAGGAERVLSLIATNLNQDIFNVTLLVLGFKKDTVYDISNIKTIYFNKSRVLEGVPQLLKYFTTHKTDIVLSCMTHLNTALALILLGFPKIKLVAREANIKAATEVYTPKPPSLSKRVTKYISYNRFNKIICQSKDMADEVVLNKGVDSNKVVIINNPISNGFKTKNISNTTNTTVYITVGRLHKEKGHERILKALAQLEHNFKYYLIGSGEEQAYLINLISELQLESKVEMIQYSKNIPEYLSKSDYFLQGSFAEGFPNALLESCAVGTPALVFESQGGTSEIIQEGINGYTAKDESEFLKLLQVHNLPVALKPNEVSNSVISKFNKEKIVNQYESLFLSL